MEQKPRNFSEALGVVFKAYQKHNTPEAQKKWKEDMYEHRWKYFGLTNVFILVCLAFLWFGNIQKEFFYSPIHWYIWMGASSAFLLIGIWVWISYLKLILRG